MAWQVVVTCNSDESTEYQAMTKLDLVDNTFLKLADQLDLFLLVLKMTRLRTD